MPCLFYLRESTKVMRSSPPRLQTPTQPFSAANFFFVMYFTFLLYFRCSSEWTFVSKYKIRTLTSIGAGFGFAVYMTHNRYCFINFTAAKPKVFMIYSYEIAFHPLVSTAFFRYTSLHPLSESNTQYHLNPYIYHALCLCWLPANRVWCLPRFSFQPLCESKFSAVRSHLDCNFFRW